MEVWTAYEALTFKCVTFSSGPPTETHLRSSGSQQTFHRGKCQNVQMLGFVTNIFVHLKLRVSLLSFMLFQNFFFLIFFWEWICCWSQLHLCVTALSVSFSSVSHLSVEPQRWCCIILAYLLRPCVYIRSRTRFLLTLEAELASKNYSFSGQFCGTDHCLV